VGKNVKVRTMVGPRFSGGGDRADCQGGERRSDRDLHPRIDLAWSTLFSGSVAEKVVRLAESSVLTVRKKRAETH